MRRPEVEDVVGAPAPLTVAKARRLAACVFTILGDDAKSVHISPSTHRGKIRLDVFMRPLRSNEEPEPVPFILNREDVIGAPEA